jgi:biotin carboxyl carrier protein
MEQDPSTPPSEKIWGHDDEVLQAALAFYAELSDRTALAGWDELAPLLEGERDARVAGSDDALWRACQASHRGFQVGLELLLLIPRLGVASGFHQVDVDERLRVVFPEAFLDKDAMAQHTKALAPPPLASADEIVTPMGGAFYAREAPHLPLLVDVGDHFEAGQPLFIIEVMKMFNKILAPFSGTVTENCMADKDGMVVAKGQTIFKIEPDERLEEETEEVRGRRVREATLALL